MSRLARLPRTASFRLAAAFSILMTLMSLLILGLSYRQLAASLERRDQEAIAEKFSDLERNALTSSMEQLRDEMRFDKKRGKTGPFFARLMARSGGQVFLQQGQASPARLEALPSPAPGAPLIRLPETSDEPALEIISRPISENLILQVAKSAAGREDVLRRFRRILFYMTAMTLALAAILGAALSERALRPVRGLIEAVKSIQSGNMSARVAERGAQDELDELGILFNGMLDRIEMLVAGMRHALDDVAHDLRTPMTRLRGTAEVALAAETDPAAHREALAECIEQSDIVISMIKTLMDISEAEHGAMRLDLEPVDLGELLRQAGELYRLTAEEKGIRLRVNGSDGIILSCDRSRLRRVIGNLLDNALKYSCQGGTTELRAFQKDGEAAVAVSDAGPGIAPEDLPRIWERLYRGKASRLQPGLGLGLSLVRAIVAAHKGRVEVESAPGKGSTFTAYFPCKDANIAEM